MSCQQHSRTGTANAQPENQKCSSRSVSRAGFPPILRPYCHNDSSPFLVGMHTFLCLEIIHAHRSCSPPLLDIIGGKSERVQNRISRDCIHASHATHTLPSRKINCYPHAHLSLQYSATLTASIQERALLWCWVTADFCRQNRPSTETLSLPANDLSTAAPIRICVLVKARIDLGDRAPIN